MIQLLDLKPLLEVTADGRVTTTTLLPSGALVDVVIRPDGPDRFTVTDDASGMADLMALGHAQLSAADKRRARDIAERFGLVFSRDEFQAHDVAADQLPATIVYVADAARAWADAVIAAVQTRVVRTLGETVEARLKQLLPTAGISKDREVMGASTKAHRFDMVLDLPGDRHAVIELVTPHPNAISASHLKLFDLKEGKPDWLREVVTERLSDWGSADLALLSRVASHVRDPESDWGDLAKLAA